MKQNDLSAKLDTYYHQVQNIILSRQDWVTGLLPASTAINSHGNYTDAWVRDNVYSILAAWRLALAYRRADQNQGRTYLLEQSVVKLMRGLLTAMMRQADKVEKFKLSQNPSDALHAKYNTASGGIVVGDDEWGHLQLDATSLFLLMLCQMTASGLRIVFTIDEVNFVQNLVHYISRTYRTPDYGIWERGHKINNGIAELNASSIGMAKAALECLSGFNLFGKFGDQASIIHVISDDIARTRSTLESLLPRESISKEVDAAALSIIGFPAFAVDDPIIRKKTEALVCEKLEGHYGCKRFLLDGHQTAIEDNQRLHYDPQELKQFINIECEWPLFFTYLFLNNLFIGNKDLAQVYRTKLDQLLVEQNGDYLLPELYSVPIDLITAEKANPHSQKRLPNENIPLVWAQSLFMLGCLIQDNLLLIDDIDPLGRHKVIKKAQEHKLQIHLLAQDQEVKNFLTKSGVDTQTLAEIAPIQIREASELAEAYTHVGRNDRIGLTGRPLRQLRTLATSKIYMLAGEHLLFLPQCLSQKGFYLAMDNRLLVERLRLELAYIYKHWDREGNPLFVINIKKNMLDGHDGDILIAFIKELQHGYSQGIPLQIGTLLDISQSSNHEKINYLHDFEFSKASWQESNRPFLKVLATSDELSISLDNYTLDAWSLMNDEELIEQLKSNSNLYAQLEVLTLLFLRNGLHYDTQLPVPDDEVASVQNLLDEVYERAGDQHIWPIVRRCAGLLGKYDINLEQAATELLVRQHAISLGNIYSRKATLTRPTDSFEILELIKTYNEDASQIILIQELILYLGMFIKSNSELFADIYTIRVGHILQLIIINQQRKSNNASVEQAFYEILSLSPYELAQNLKTSLEGYHSLQEMLNLSHTTQYQNYCDYQFKTVDWYDWREQQGSFGRENQAFFSGIWSILHHCQGLMIGSVTNNKNIIFSEQILSQMTAGEQSFKLYVSHLLNKIHSPVCRQMTVEAIEAIGLIFKTSKSAYRNHVISTDDIINQAIDSLLQQTPFNLETYNNYASSPQQIFYRLSRKQVATAFYNVLMQADITKGVYCDLSR